MPCHSLALASFASGLQNAEKMTAKAGTILKPWGNPWTIRRVPKSVLVVEFMIRVVVLRLLPW